MIHEPRPVDPALGSGTTDAGIDLQIRQRRLAAQMKADGRSILSAAKRYVPVLTKPVEAERPPKADKVKAPVPASLRRVK